MARDNNKEITMEKDPDFDYVIEESGNTSIILRRISWNGRPFKLDLRKYSYQDASQERAMKGVTLSDAGADELASTLVETGYGNTKRIKAALMKRVDYTDNTESEVEEDGEEEYYDPSELFAE